MPYSEAVPTAKRLFLAVLSSGEFGGTTLTEIRTQWTAADLFDALDHLAWLRATEWANMPKGNK